MTKPVPIYMDERATVALLIRLAALARNTDAMRVYGVHDRQVNELAETLRSGCKDASYWIERRMLDVVLGELKQAREIAVRRMNASLRGNSNPPLHDAQSLATYSSLCEAMRNASKARDKARDKAIDKGCAPCTQDCRQGRDCPTRSAPPVTSLALCVVLACAILTIMVW